MGSYFGPSIGGNLSIGVVTLKAAALFLFQTSELEFEFNKTCQNNYLVRGQSFSQDLQGPVL
jgi:hypothetical protein